MSRIWERVTFRANGPVVGRPGIAVAEILGLLEEGVAWDRAGKTLGIEPADLLAAIAADALDGDDSLGLPLVQGSPRRPKLLRALSEPATVETAAKVDRASWLSLSAGLLQIHDFWDASHDAAQAAEDQGEVDFSAYWHGIAHRREPDAGNADYWFRRVGRHPIFAPLWAAARPIVEEAGDSVQVDRLGHAGAWEPTAMIELCARALPGSPEEALGRRLQRLEMLMLLEANAEAVGIA
jgi:hypothetical protein